MTFIQTQSFSLSKKQKKILLCLQLCITKSLKLNCRRIEKTGLLKYLSYLLKLSKEEKRLFQLLPTFYPPLSPTLSSSVSHILTGEIALEHVMRGPREHDPAMALTGCHMDPQMECRVCPLSCSTPPFYIIPIGIIHSTCTELLHV